MFEEFLKKTQKLLVEDIRNFKATMDASPEMMCLSEGGQTIYVNTSWALFTGRLVEEELGDRRFTSVHPSEQLTTTETIHTAFKKQIPYRIKYRLKNKSNEYGWVVEDGIPIFSSTKALLGYVSKCVNIDIQVKLEEQLSSTEIKYRRLFEAAHDGILILDSTTGEITDVNPYLIELLGYSQEEFLGKKLWEVGAFKNIEASKNTFKTVQENGYVRYDNLPLETIDGKLIPVEFVSNSYKAGDIIVIQCNIRNISERKKLEEIEKRILNVEQEEKKIVFISDVTHELRTPLAIIKGNVELALKSTNDSTRETFEIINDEVNHLSKILIDLVVLTTDNKIIHDTIISTKVDLKKIILDVVKRLKIISTKKNITIIAEDLPTMCIYGDSHYLEKLFFNILSNAIYYGKYEGSISVQGSVDTEQVLLRIKDNGIGITREDLPNIFGRFYRSEQAREINKEGTGLGLAISKWIVEAHHGEISVDSALNKGTTFRISFPVLI